MAMTSVTLQISCLLILSVCGIFTQPPSPANEQWSNKYSNLEKFVRLPTNYKDKQQQTFGTKQLAPNQFSNLNTFDRHATNDLNKQQQKIYDKQIVPNQDSKLDMFGRPATNDLKQQQTFGTKQMAPIQFPNLVTFGRPATNDLNKQQQKLYINQVVTNQNSRLLKFVDSPTNNLNNYIRNSKKWDNVYPNVMINNSKNIRRKEYNSASDKKSMKITEKNIPTAAYFDIFTTTSQANATKMYKRLNFVKEMLNMIHNIRVFRVFKNRIADWSLRKFNLVKFLEAINNKDAQRYARAHPDDAYTLNQECFHIDYDCIINNPR